MSLWDLFTRHANGNENNRDVTDKMEEINRIERQFLDIWVDSHRARSIPELREYETRAWEVWEPIEDLCDDYMESTHRLASIPYLDTGHNRPPGTRTTMYRCHVFKNQRDSIKKRRESMERMKFGNRNLRGRF